MRRRTIAGFTLVELLVTLGLIALLLGILLPALSAARSRSRLVACGAQLREAGRAMTLRAGDTQGFLPLAGTVVVPDGTSGYGSLPTALNDSRRSRYVYVDERASGITPTREQVAPLPAALLPYLGVEDVEITQGTLFGWQKVAEVNRPIALFECPAAPERLDSPPQTTMLAVGKLGYHFGWAVRFDYGLNEGVFGFVSDRQFDHYRLRGHLARVGDASRTLLLADADANRAHGPLMAWSHGGEEDKPLTLADVLPTFVDGDEKYGPALDVDRHDARLNGLFADGHVVPSATKLDAIREIYLRTADR